MTAARWIWQPETMTARERTRGGRSRLPEAVWLACAVWVAGAGARAGEAREWITFGGQWDAAPVAAVERERTEHSVVLSATVPGVWLRRGDGGGAGAAGGGPGVGSSPAGAAEGFDWMEMPDHAHLREIGKPQLPAKIYMVEIPGWAEPEATLAAGRMQRVENVRIVPAQPLPPDAYPAPAPEPFAYDEGTYVGGGAYPASRLERVEDVWIRDRRFLRIVAVPGVYDPADSSVEFAVDYEVRIEWDAGGAPGAQVADASGLPIYMILVPDAFATNAALEALAEWKARKGLDVRVLKTSAIDAGGAPSNEQIVAHLRALAEEDYPDYLLAVGTHLATGGVAGAYFNTSTADYYGYTDLDMACRTGGDYYPDLWHGRFPAATQAELTAMATKAMRMDRTPPADGGYRKACVAGQIQDSDDRNNVADRLFCETADSIARYFEANTGGAGYSCVRAVVNPDGMAATGKWNSSSILWNGTEAIGTRIHTQFVSVATAQGRIGAQVNSGISVLQHRDHGYVNGVGWGDPQYLYTHVNALTNGERQPAVFSINCNSGMYNFPNNFAKAWLAKTNGGAYAVFAPVDTSYSWLNDWLAHGFYAGFLGDYLSGHNASTAPDWPKDLPIPGGSYGAAGSAWKLGQILNYGKFYMAEKFWQDEDTFRLFHLFGDPEGQLRLLDPKPIAVGHPAELPTGAVGVTVTVSQAGATVCLYGPEMGVHAVAAAAGGKATFALAPTNRGTLHVTATGRDLRPYEGEIAVYRGGRAFEFRAMPAGNGVMLRWSDPRESGWGSGQVRVRAGTTGYPAGPGDGRAVYAGEARKHFDAGASSRVANYYSIWATDDGETFHKP